MYIYLYGYVYLDIINFEFEICMNDCCQDTYNFYYGFHDFLIMLLSLCYHSESLVVFTLII